MTRVFVATLLLAAAVPGCCRCGQVDNYVAECENAEHLGNLIHAQCRDGELFPPPHYDDDRGATEYKLWILGLELDRAVVDQGDLCRAEHGDDIETFECAPFHACLLDAGYPFPDAMPEPPASGETVEHPLCGSYSFAVPTPDNDP